MSTIVGLDTTMLFSPSSDVASGFKARKFTCSAVSNVASPLTTKLAIFLNEIFLRVSPR